MKFQFYLYFVAEMSIANRFISKHVKRQIFLKKYIDALDHSAIQL